MSSADRWQPAGCTWLCSAGLRWMPLRGPSVEKGGQANLIWQPAAHCCSPSSDIWRTALPPQSSWPPGPSVPAELGCSPESKPQSLRLVTDTLLPGAPGPLPLPQSAFIPKDGMPTSAGKLLLTIPAPTDFFPHLNSQVERVCIMLLLIKHVPQPMTTPVPLH